MNEFKKKVIQIIKEKQVINLLSVITKSNDFFDF